MAGREDAKETGFVARTKAAASRRLDALRRRSRLVDRLVRTALAYTQGGGDREAAGLSYYAFLAVFPLIFVAVAVLGLVMGDASEIRDTVLRGLRRALPGSGRFLEDTIDTIVDQAAVIGVVGLVGLAYSGLGAVDVLRGALDRIFGVEKLGGIKGKLRNLRFVAITGVLLLLSIALSTLASGALDDVLGDLGARQAEVRIAGRVLALVLTFATDVFLFFVLYMQLPDHDLGWRDVAAGAVLGSIGFVALKEAGTLLAIGATRASTRYGIAATVFGLLLVINVASRLVLFSAQWAQVAIEQRRERKPGFPPP